MTKTIKDFMIEALEKVNENVVELQERGVVGSYNKAAKKRAEISGEWGRDDEGNEPSKSEKRKIMRNPNYGNPNARPLARTPDADKNLKIDKTANYSGDTGHEIDSMSRKSGGAKKNIAGPKGRLPESFEERLIASELFTEEEILGIMNVINEGNVKAYNKYQKDIATGTASERPDLDAGDRSAEKRIQQIRNKNRDAAGTWRSNSTGKSHIDTSKGPQKGQLPGKR